MAKSVTDSRQVVIRRFLDQLAGRTNYEGTDDNKPADTTELDNLLDSLNLETTQPLRMSASNPNDRVVNIGSSVVTNTESGRNRTITPVGGGLPSLTSGTVDFPSTSGGTITVTPGNNGILTVPSNEYINVLIYLDGNGDLNVISGTADAVEANATVPTIPSGTIGIGYVTLFNNAGTIDNIAQDKIYQFASSGGAGGTGGGVQLLGGGNKDWTIVAGYSNDFSMSTPGPGPLSGTGGQVPYNGSFFGQSVNFSGSVWFKTTSANNGAIFSSGDSNTSNSRFAISMNVGQPLVIISTDGTTTAKLYRASATFNDNAWHHLVFTFAANDLRMYIDGVELTTGAATLIKQIDLVANSVPTGGGDIGLGTDIVAGSRTSGWIDQVDEITYWDKVLSGAEVTELYNSGQIFDPSTHSAAANLIEQWRMGDGDTLPTITGQINGQNGTIAGTSTYVSDAVPAASSTSSGDFVFDAPIQVEVAGLPNTANNIPITESPIQLGNGEVAYVNLNSVSGGPDLTVGTSLPEDVPVGNTIIMRREDLRLVYGNVSEVYPQESTQGSINYIENWDIESNADFWNTYDDGVVTEPVDGTGGSPAGITVSRTENASEILRSSGSLKISKNTTDSTGEGVSTDFSIDPRDKNSLLQVKFDYKNLDSNYVNGDLKVFVYDIDNSTLIGSVENDTDGDMLLSQNDGVTFAGTFIATDSLNYRLIFHVTSSNVTAWNVIVDNIIVGPDTLIPTSAKNEIETNILPSTVSSSGAIASLGFSNLEVGKWYELTGQFLLNLDQSSPDILASVFAQHNGINIGAMRYQLQETSDTGTDFIIAGITAKFQATSTTLDIIAADVTASSTIGGNNTREQTYVQLEKRNDLSPTAVVSSTELQFQTVKVRGIGTSLVPTGTLGPTFANPVIFEALSDENDPFGIYNSSNGQITIPKTGWYRMSARLEISSTLSDTASTGVRIVNVTQGGSVIATGNQRAEYTGGGTSVTQKYPECSGIFKANKGDIVEVRSFAGGSTPSYLNSFGGSYFFLESLPDYTTLGVYDKEPEYLESEIVTTTTTTVADTEVDIADGELELTPGEYIIGYNVTVRTRESAGVNSNSISGRVRITDSSNNYIVRTASFVVASLLANFNHFSKVSAQTKLVVTATETFKLRLTCAVSAATGDISVMSPNITGSITGPDTTGVFWAQRLK